MIGLPEGDGDGIIRPSIHPSIHMTAHPLNIRLPSSNFQSSPVTVQSDGLYDCSLGRRKVDSRYTTMINQSTFLLPVRLPSSVMMARINRAVIGGHGGPSVCLDISRVRLAFTLTHSFTHARPYRSQSQRQWGAEHHLRCDARQQSRNNRSV